jgi:hypothetical protein
MAKNKREKGVAPFPIDLLARHSAALALPSAGFGMVTRLLIHYWLTDCRPLPKGIADLCAIARAHKPTFSNHRQDIMLIINDLAPILKIRHESYWQRRNNLSALANTTNAKRALRRAEKMATQQAQGMPAPQAPKRAPIGDKRAMPSADSWHD